MVKHVRTRVICAIKLIRWVGICNKMTYEVKCQILSDLWDGFANFPSIIHCMAIWSNFIHRRMFSARQGPRHVSSCANLGIPPRDVPSAAHRFSLWFFLR
ncbi:Os01g0316001 [Oryza sativa Japonica Group]|uniref:Uncharacterized protein n=2 Tax=Oryza sativa subsp. japonica TaxID=39947 RepID=A0A8J8Y0C3_ORYSJ|nr:hypothetical protein OsJ_01502 [Oryza sativa Japonica Group]KAB8081179.1 hypothetical protein EE612_002140 [Oryza sativa]BAS71814.1 Os01g0316001 [Oryza sativa Japonica Group]